MKTRTLENWYRRHEVFRGMTEKKGQRLPRLSWFGGGDDLEQTFPWCFSPAELSL